MIKKKSRRKQELLSADTFSERISMTTLDGNLSEWVSIARNQAPVIVDRYDSPWICLVSYSTWVDVDLLRSYIPGRSHALVLLRNELDGMLAYESELLQGLTQRSQSRLDSRFAIRAWVLQIIYSTTSTEQVYETMGYNMLWRWFVGYQHASEPRPDIDDFVHDIRMVSANYHIIELVYRCLNNYGYDQKGNGDFRINFSLLNALRDLYAPTKKTA